MTSFNKKHLYSADLIKQICTTTTVTAVWSLKNVKISNKYIYIFKERERERKRAETKTHFKELFSGS